MVALKNTSTERVRQAIKEKGDPLTLKNMDPKILLIYENCLKARYLDERLQQLYYAGVPMRTFMSSVGSEVGPSTVATLLHPEDGLIPHYRGFAEVLSKQMPLDVVAAEVLGKKTGSSKGIGDSCPFHDTEHNIFGSSIVLGTKFSIAIGIGLAMKLKRETGVIAVFFGDGESSKSTFGSALNLASLLELPILFICRNNGVSIDATIGKMSSTKTIAERAQGYNVSATTVQDTDWEQLYEKSNTSIAHVRRNRKPFLLEIEEKRFGSHLIKRREQALLGTMIPRDEDPLCHFETTLKKMGVTDDELSLLRTRTAALVETEVATAMNAAFLSSEEILSIYHE